MPKNFPLKNTNHEDAALKLATEWFRESILKVFGINKTFVESTPTELVELNITRLYMDFTFLTIDGEYIHIEFQSTNGGIKDIQRFHSYEALLHYKTGKPVTTYVVFSGDIKNPISQETYGINTYKVIPISMADKNSDEVFEQIESKKVNHEYFSKDDFIALALTPLMGGTLSKTEKIIKAFSLVKDQPDPLAQKAFALIYTFAEKFLDYEDFKVIREVFSMTRLGQMVFDDGKAVGQAMGIDVTLKIISLLGNGKSINEICSLYDIAKDKVTEIRNTLIENWPPKNN